MLDDVVATGDAERYVKEVLDRGDRLMGFGHRIRPTARYIGPAPRPLEAVEA